MLPIDSIGPTAVSSEFRSMNYGSNREDLGEQFDNADSDNLLENDITRPTRSQSLSEGSCRFGRLRHVHFYLCIFKLHFYRHYLHTNNPPSDNFPDDLPVDAAEDSTSAVSAGTSLSPSFKGDNAAGAALFLQRLTLAHEVRSRFESFSAYVVH